jgi:type 1 fimbria pilin
MEIMATQAYLIAAIILTGANVAPAHAESIHLICLGGGSANKANVTNVYGSNSNGDSGYGQIVGRRSEGFEDQVNIEINDDDTGRIRVPRTMLPSIHGGDDGWMKFKDIKRTDNEITGSAAVNALNNPKVRLDRLTGNVTIAGKAGQFHGRCEAYDPAKVQRRF